MADIFNTINSSTPNSVARAIANEVVAGKNAIASALSNKGQSVENSDTFESMANKILSITGEVNVTPIQGIPSDWHDLAQVVASNTLAEFPYSFAILLSKGMQSILLTGSNRYITSDGGFFAGDRMHTFDVSKDDIGGDINATFSGTLCGLTSPITIQANNVGSVGNVRLTGNGTSINTLIDSWNITNPTNQLTLTEGDGTQIPTAGFKGVVSGMTTVVELCENAGGDFGNITLIADGIKSINTLVSEWNASNPTKQIIIVSGNSAQIPTANITLITEDVLLTGGVIGNVGKSTRWVIFLNNADNRQPGYNFGTTLNAQNKTIVGQILTIMINNVSINNIVLTDTTLANYIFCGTDLEELRFPAVSLRGTQVQSLNIPAGIKKLYFNSGGNGLGVIANVISFKSLILPPGLELVVFGQTGFSSSGITSLRLPDSILAVVGGGSLNIFSSSRLGYVYLSNPRDLFTLELNGCNDLSIVEVKIGWNWTLNIGTTSPLTAPSILALFNNFVDKRKDGINPTTVTTSTSSNVVTAVNGNFTKVFHVGEFITIGGVSKAIRSIESDDQLTLTSIAGTTGIGQAYNINKTLTIGATNLAKMTAEELLIATNKGWTLL